MDQIVGADVRLEPDVEWDGTCLLVWADTGRGRVRCDIPRDTIHALPPFSDAIGREILRDRAEIVERMRPVLLRRIARGGHDVIRIDPEDL